MLSAYSIIMILIILLGILSHVLPKAKYAAAPLEDTESSVEVGPGEWEGEVPEETSGELELPEGESVTPEIGDGVTDEATEEELSEEITEESSEDLTVISEAEATEETTGAETYDSLEACEEVYGEEGCAIVDGSGVEGAKLYQVLLAPILGFADAIDVCIFIMMLGGLLAVVARTKALETGIKLLVQKTTW